MYTLDRERILNGTPQKEFDNARNKMFSHYDEETAENFFNTYKDKPLSFIMENSTAIFSEPIYGLSFYKELINRPINPMLYKEEFDKVCDHLLHCESQRVPYHQTLMYEDLRDRVKLRMEETAGLAECLKRGTYGIEEEAIANLFDIIYDVDTDVSGCDMYTGSVAKTIFDMENPYLKIPLAYMLCRKHPEFCVNLADNTCGYVADLNKASSEDIKKSLGIRDCISTMMKDKECVSEVSKFPNPNIFSTWYGYYNSPHYLSSIPEVYPKYYPETSIGDTLFIPIDIYESVESADMQDLYKNYRYRNLYVRKAYYEFYDEGLDFAANLSEERLQMEREVTSDMLGDIDAQMSLLEWGDNGEPDPVIASQILTTKEKAVSEKEKMDKIKVSHYTSMDDLRRDVKGAVNEIREEVRHCKTKDAFKKSSSKIKQSVLDVHKITISENNDAKEVISDIDDAINEGLSFFEDVYGSFDEAGEEKEEEKKDKKNDDDKEPEKPKRSLAEKIQDKALDHEAKATARDAKVKEKLTKIGNAAKAITGRPKRILEDIGAFVKGFEKMDEKKRKEYLLKPGYRHKIFKKLRVALMYGGVAHFNLAYLPFVALLRHGEKEKNARLRNELSRELEAEIKICEERINDANSAGDTKSKYELMRIKEKLESEKVRVRTNSKYI